MFCNFCKKMFVFRPRTLPPTPPTCLVSHPAPPIASLAPTYVSHPLPLPAPSTPPPPCLSCISFHIFVSHCLHLWLPHFAWHWSWSGWLRSAVWPPPSWWPPRPGPGCSKVMNHGGRMKYRWKSRVHFLPFSLYSFVCFTILLELKPTGLPLHRSQYVVNFPLLHYWF